MKKSLKIIQVLLVIAILFTSLFNPSFVYAVDEVASGTCGDDITWSLDSNGTLTITGSGAMSGSSCAWEEYREQVKEVVFEGNITSISACAFEYNTNLETITLPDTVTTIGRRAFAECTNLKSVKFPESITDIGISSFYKCTSLENVELSDRLIYIRDNAFADCTSLKSITIKSTLALIGSDYPETTISETAEIYGYKNTGVFSYARYYGRKFTDLNTNEVYTGTITNEDFLNALPTDNVQALGITSHNGSSWSGNALNGYHTCFCDEKDENNETYQAIKAKVEEITADCTTEKEKAYQIMIWAYVNIDYQKYNGATAEIDRVYSIFNEKKGSCEAYTMLTNYMLYLCGIPTATVSNQTHEWTAAYVDGEWIYVDSTQRRFETTPNTITTISFAYDGLVYVINDPKDGPMVTGLLMSDDEKNELTSFTIPTNSYMKGIYETTFDKGIGYDDMELRAEVGTVGAEYIKNNCRYWYEKDNMIISSETEVVDFIKGDLNNDGIINILDITYGYVKLEYDDITDEELERGDVTGEGVYNISDINKMYLYLEGKIDEL